MIPTSGSWTIIFNKESNAWGIYFYKQSDDVLPVIITPVAAAHQEQLDVRVPIVVDVKDAVINHLRSQLTSLHGFNPDMYTNAASYALVHNLDKVQGKAWAERAYGSKASYTNGMLLAEYEDALGNAAKAKELHRC